MPPEGIKETTVLLKKLPSSWSPFIWSLIFPIIGFIISFVVVGSMDDLGGLWWGILIFQVSIIISGLFLWQGFSVILNNILKREKSSFAGYLLSSLFVFPVVVFIAWIIV